jgi:hypothetical protein
VTGVDADTLHPPGSLTVTVYVRVAVTEVAVGLDTEVDERKLGLALADQAYVRVGGVNV